ncbi:CapA family protein [Stackebrandtia nassauensis DSM 44728]|uniref:CapA family protein n=1 Tax=Stackebrandtia nassauensis (strain DSM 44728 / CIP 108903 / NRRL B-16338 / NBRC 102104 / LLR-40K-21) TaxID=446470 RepID=D3Q0J4_STANL|nr:CapA family protein [Stackebrandtia nassauensis DSM 44728]
MTGAHSHRDRVPVWRRPVVVAGTALVVLAAVTLTVVWAVSEDKPASAAEDPGSEDTESSAASSPEPDPDAITVTAVGDTIMGNLPDGLPDDGAGYFDKVAEHLKGDIVFGNLDGALSEHDDYKKCKSKKKCFYIRMPPEYASLLKDAGFTVMNGSNNHAFDSGPEGYADTQAALDGAGIDYLGVKGEIVETEVRGVKTAMVGFSTYDRYDSLLDLNLVSQLVSAAAERADVVVVSMHLGAEGVDARHTPEGPETFYGEDRGDSRAATHAAVDAGADLVLGHGPHVLRGMEFYKDRLIAHSLGNFAGYGVLKTSGALGRGAILTVTVDKQGEWVSGKVIPSIMVDGGYPAVDEDNGAHADITELSKDDFPDSGVTLDEKGKISKP